MTAPHVIDTKMHGRPGITGVFLIRDEKTALIEAGPGSSLRHVLAGLERAGIERLDFVVVTHIHLDHAGASGALLQRFPEAQLAVHEVGAPHMVDPTKLWSSASRIYGDRMTELWGEMKPVPEDRILTLTDGDTIDLGARSLRAVETPGHARHHHAFLDSSTGTVYTGDAMGVRLQEVGAVRPATPPPEFNLEDCLSSIEKIRALGAERLCLTHFGASDTGPHPLSVDELCDRAIDAFNNWAGWVSEARSVTRDIDEVTRIVREQVETHARGSLSPEATDRMEQTTSYRMNTSGYMRYFDKKEAASQL